ncbi:MAG: hypothetical protein WAO52_18905 [Prolixibacteraceae bacterium]
MKSKLIILALASILAFSCSTNKYIERTDPGSTSIAFLDFKPFLEKGFIFSTGDINQTYIPQGILYYTTEPDMVCEYRSFNTLNEFSNRTGIITEGDQDYILIGSHPVQKSNLNEILQMVYEYSISKGSNGVINLKYIIQPNKTIEISGTLIKLEK